MNLIVGIVFFIWVIRNINFWISLWQIKEYRLDRLVVHIKETAEGKELFISPFLLIKLSLLVLFSFIIINPQYILLYNSIIAMVFLVESVFVIKEIKKHVLRRPVFTIKALFVGIITLCMIMALYLVPLVDSFVWLLLLDRLVPFIIGCFVLLLSVPTELLRDIKVEAAIKKLKNHKNMTIIGITGSYGKSSTKEYLAQILSHQFNVLYTKGTNNTPIGIANTVITGLRDDTEVFIVEMGAYKKGEIAQLCSIVKPQIGILTAVNYQHLSLFGSWENIMMTKYELIESLPKNGFAIFNGNNTSSYSLFKKTKKKKILYAAQTEDLKESIQKDAEIYASNIKLQKKSISCTVQIAKTSFVIKAPLIGYHSVENILPGVYIAFYLGMKPVAIKQAITHLIPLSKTMITHTLASGVTVVDDTFNANPNAILAAVEYIKIYSGKKLFVLQPMIELGTRAQEEHQKIARAVALTCDMLFITNRNFYSSIEKGIQEARNTCQLKVANPSEIADYIKQHSQNNDVIVFEGKESAFALQLLV